MQSNKSILLKSTPIFLWVVINGLLLYRNGIIQDGEAIKYLWAADNLSSLEVFPKYIFYASYIFIIAILKSKVLIVALQFILSGLSLITFMRGVEQLKGNAIFAGILFACCWPIQYWNSALYTESFFISGMIFLWYFVLRKAWKWFVVLLLPMLFLRPVMVVFLVPLLFWIGLERGRSWKITMFSIAGIVGIGALLSRIYFFPEYFDFIVLDQVICEVEEKTPVWKLMGKKLFYFWTLYRPHYSGMHNVMNLIFPVLLIIGVLKSKKPYADQLKFLVFLFLWISVFVLYTCVDWNNRFVAPVLPFVILLVCFKNDSGVQGVKRS